jgi:HAD superfamily hydrolase (TIGR01549 family)
MDGVLLDTRPSFTAAVAMAAGACAPPPGLSLGWGEAEVEALRLAGGFNNDWDAAAAVALLGPENGPGAAWEALCARLRAEGGGPAAVMGRCGRDAWERVRGAVAPVFQRLYAGARAGEVYGIEPTESGGLYEREVPLVTAEELESTNLPIGILTGRTRGEAGLGLSLLGIQLPEARLVCDTGPRFRKPRPDGLLALAGATSSRRPLYVGDTVDDMDCAQNARAEGLDVLFAGIAPEGSERERRFRGGGASAVAVSLRAALAMLLPETAEGRADNCGG